MQVGIEDAAPLLLLDKHVRSTYEVTVAVVQKPKDGPEVALKTAAPCSYPS